MTARYLSLDLSTQSLKAILANEKLEPVHECVIEFDKDLPEFKTKDGVHHHSEEQNRITSPTLMWLKAVDLILMKIREDGVALNNVRAISGTGQQHGSVYWKNSARLTLARLDSRYPMVDQLQDSFSVLDSPVWMDASTVEQCKKLEEVAGSAAQLASITGSRAYERFTGSQIAKIFACRFEK